MPDIVNTTGAKDTRAAVTDSEMPKDSIKPVEALKTRNVVLDTQVFYAHAFNYESARIVELRELVEEGKLKLFLTDVVSQEVRSGIRKLVNAAVGEFTNKERKAIRILSNLPGQYELLFDAKKSDNVVQQLEAQFDRFLAETGAEIISSRELRVGPLLDRYFASLPPFEASEEKKAEFPDAATVAAIIAYAEATKCDFYFVSGDSGARTAADESVRIFPVESLEALLASATVSYSDENVRLKAQLAFKDQLRTLPDAVMRHFSELDFEWHDFDYGNALVVSVEVGRVNLSPALLVDLSDTSAEFLLEAAVHYTADLRYDDDNATAYDREDRRSYVFNRIHADAEARIIVPVNVTLSVDAVSGHSEIVEVDVNGGRGIRVVADTVVETGSDLDDEHRASWE